MKALVALLLVVGVCTGALSCRDRYLWPFTSDSIWNMPIGSGAVYSPANIFSTITPGYMFGDNAFIYKINKHDPYTPWYDQSTWGNPKTDARYCEIRGRYVQDIQFPYSVVATAFGNNDPAVMLQPDNVTVLQMNSFYRCNPGSPILATHWPKPESVLGPGYFGAFGGSGLSAYGGTIRLGELNKTSGPITHTIKIELAAKDYYYGGNQSKCYRWPAQHCDGYWDNKTSPNHYGGKNPLLAPGSLLAIRPNNTDVARKVVSVPGKKMLQVLTDYGAYVVADTVMNRGCFVTEDGVQEQFSEEYGFNFSAHQGEAFYNELLALFQALEVVVNNGPNSIGGGGTPRAPLAPPICD